MAKIKKISRKIIGYLPKRLSWYLERTYYCHLVSNYNELHEPEFIVIKNLIKEGDFVLDIGANIGVYTKFLSRMVGAKGKIISIEPIPRTYNILCSNIKKLGLDNVQALNYACNDTNGYVTMEIPRSKEKEEDFYGARIPLNDYPQNTWRKLKVEAKTLDTLLSDQSLKLTFIKCDVEGNENKVLEGATNTLSRDKPVLMIEIVKNPDDVSSPAYKTFSLLKNYGYQSFYSAAGKLHLRKEGIKKLNYFFLTNQQIKYYDDFIS